MWCHRDPVTAVASFCSLIEHGMAVSTRPLDLHGIGATWSGLLSRAMERALRARAAIPRESLVDAPYPGSTTRSAPAGPSPRRPGWPTPSPARRAAARTGTTWRATG